jgi:hypothetical protein
MARIVVVAGTDAGQRVADVFSAAGHAVARTQSPGVTRDADVVFVEGWLHATGPTTPADVPVVVIAPQDALAAAIDAVKGGAYDLLRVPCTAD